MTNIGSWSVGVIRRTVGTFITATVSTFIGVGTLGAVDPLDASAVSFGDPHLYLAALSAGLVAAVVRQLVPSLLTLGKQLEDTEHRELDV